MTLSSVSALYIRSVLYLLAVAGLSLLGGCSKTVSTRPTPPPVVDCEAGPASLIPPLPDNPAAEAEWIVTVLGLYEGEVVKRKAVRQCLQDLKDKGVIR